MRSGLSYSPLAVDENNITVPPLWIGRRSFFSYLYDSNILLKVLPILVFTFTLIFYLWQLQLDSLMATGAHEFELSKNQFKLVLFGDSLLNVPYRQFELQSKIQQQFPNYEMEIVNSGINGDRISFMFSRLNRDVLSHHPDAVMIFWDSDISDQSIDTLDMPSTKLKYKDDLHNVLVELKASVKYISVSGTLK